MLLYKYTSTPRICNPIPTFIIWDEDECAQGGVGQQYCTQECVNSPGSYSCQCNLPGYTLYTASGVQGWSLPPNENGLIPGDQFYINHTCVRKYTVNMTEYITEIIWGGGGEKQFVCFGFWIFSGLIKIWEGSSLSTNTSCWLNLF